MALFTGELQRALAAPGCPLCRLVRRQEEAWIWHTLYEFTGDPGVRHRLDASYGLCHRHAHLLRRVLYGHRLLGGSGVARIYETVVLRYSEQLAALQGAGGRLKQWLGSERQQLAKLELKGCPLCLSSQQAERGAVFFLLEALQKEGQLWRPRLKSSEGLCNPHLLLALEDHQAREDPELRQFLIQDQLERLAELQGRLYQLQRKQRYDVHEAISAEEACSWQEAIWRFTGMQYEKLLWQVGPESDVGA